MNLPFGGNKHAEIVNFWVQKMTWWNAPSKYVSFWQVYLLHRLRDIDLNPCNAMHVMFHWNGVQDYEVKTSEKWGLYECRYRWSDRQDWVVASDKSVHEAMKTAALYSLRIILGTQLDGLIEISRWHNYVHVDIRSLYMELGAKIGRHIFTAEFSPGFVERRRLSQGAVQPNYNSAGGSPFDAGSATVSTSVPISNASSATGNASMPSVDASTNPASTSTTSGTDESYKEMDLLKLNAAIVNGWTLEKKADLLFQFWTVRKRKNLKFPNEFSLFKSRNIRESNGLHHFLLLFPGDARKNKQLEINKSTVSIEFKFKINGVEKKYVEKDNKPRDAENKGGWKGMKIILGKQERDLISHVSKTFFWEFIDTDKLLKRIEDHVNLPISSYCLPDPRRRPPVQVTANVRVDKPSNVPSTIQPPLPKDPPCLRPPPPPPPSSPSGLGPPRNTTPSAMRTPIQFPGPRNAFMSNQRPRMAARLPTLSVPPTRPMPRVTTRPVQPNPVPAAPFRLPAVLVQPFVPPVTHYQDEFGEFFSTSEDGTTPIIPRIFEKCTNQASNKQASSPELKVLSDVPKECPYLPFDEILGYYLPEEAADGLEVLFKGRKEAGPKFETTRYVIATLQLSDRVFQGLGSSMEEAKNKAAQVALKYLKSIEGS